MDILRLSALDISRLIKNKEILVSEVLKEQFNRIKEKEKIYNCYITLLEEEAYKQAEIVQKRIDKGELSESRLCGVPIAVKDNICTKGIRTTAASKMLFNFIPPYNASVIDKLHKEGSIIIGKANMDEFAMGSTTETSYFGATKNPVSIEHVPGGSSGGSAAAVAGYEAVAALGTDTGGSIRQPCSHCGVVGLRPTYGQVSRYGMIAYASSIDQIGPIARNVSDMTALFDCIRGHDSKDSSSIKTNCFEMNRALVQNVKGMRIGIPSFYMISILDDEVRKAVLSAVDVLKDNGAVIEEFDIEEIKYAAPAYYVLTAAEASSNLSRYDGVKYGYRCEEYNDLTDMYVKTRSEGFGSEVKRRIMIGAYVLSEEHYDAYYNKALKVRMAIKESLDRAFERYDIILSPTSPEPAQRLSKIIKNPLSLHLCDLYTVVAGLAGIPAVSVPSDRTSNGLPIGLQFMGKAFDEETIIRAAYTYEQSVLSQSKKRLPLL